MAWRRGARSPQFGAQAERRRKEAADKAKREAEERRERLAEAAERPPVDALDLLRVRPCARVDAHLRLTAPASSRPTAPAASTAPPYALSPACLAASRVRGSRRGGAAAAWLTRGAARLRRGAGGPQVQAPAKGQRAAQGAAAPRRAGARAADRPRAGGGVRRTGRPDGAAVRGGGPGELRVRGEEAGVAAAGRVLCAAGGCGRRGGVHARLPTRPASPKEADTTDPDAWLRWMEELRETAAMLEDMAGSG